MKQMYNLRLVAADALDLCIYDLRDGGEDSLPQRLQTSMSLYSTSLAVIYIFCSNNILRIISSLCLTTEDKNCKWLFVVCLLFL